MRTKLNMSYIYRVSKEIGFGDSDTRRTCRALSQVSGFIFLCVTRLQLWGAVWDTRKGVPVPGPVRQPARAFHPHLAMRRKVQNLPGVNHD